MSALTRLHPAQHDANLYGWDINKTGTSLHYDDEATLTKDLLDPIMRNLHLTPSESIEWLNSQDDIRTELQERLGFEDPASRFGRLFYLAARNKAFGIISLTLSEAIGDNSFNYAVRVCLDYLILMRYDGMKKGLLNIARQIDIDTLIEHTVMLGVRTSEYSSREDGYRKINELLDFVNIDGAPSTEALQALLEEREVAMGIHRDLLRTVQVALDGDMDEETAAFMAMMGSRI